MPDLSRRRLPTGPPRETNTRRERDPTSSKTPEARWRAGRERRAGQASASRAAKPLSESSAAAPEEPDPGSAAGYPVRPDALTLSIIRGLEQCPADDRWAVVAAIRGRAFEAAPERVALALAALGACYEMTGRIAKNHYASWQAEQPRPDEWPSTQAIASTFNDSWKRAMEVFGADAALDVLVSDFTTDTKPFSREEIVANLKEYGETGLPLLLEHYQHWAADRLGDPERHCRRYVLSHRRIAEVLGSWGEALHAAGMGERLLELHRSNAVRRGKAAEYTPERCADFVRQAFGEGPLATRPEAWTKHHFDAWAADFERGELSAGRYVKVPRANTIARVFKRWANALHAAGLLTDDERRDRASRRATKVESERLLDAVAEALGSWATSLRITDYRSYRTQRGPVDDGELLPSDATIRARLQGWDTAVALAVAQRDQRAGLSAAARPPH